MTAKYKRCLTLESHTQTVNIIHDAQRKWHIFVSLFVPLATASFKPHSALRSPMTNTFKLCSQFEAHHTWILIKAEGVSFN